MENAPYLYDVLFLAVFAVAAVCSWRRGFLAGLAELAGTLFSAAAAMLGTRALAPQLYDWFVREAVTEKVQQAVTETKLEELTREVREHNNFARRVPILEEQMKVANHRIADLEHNEKVRN